MSKIQLEFPGAPLYSTTMEVRVYDLNYGNHLGNDRVLSMVHEARVRFLQHLGYSELDIGGVGIIMADAAIRFRREVFYGAHLQIDIAVDEVKRAGFEIYYRITHQSEEVAIAKTGIVCFDYTTRKIAEIPARFRALIRP